MAEVVEQGTFMQRCGECRSLFEYSRNETFETRDYLGDLNDGRYIVCPACGSRQLVRSMQEVAAAMSRLGLAFWGSDCMDCGNTTPGGMVCDECGSSRRTVELWART